MGTSLKMPDGFPYILIPFHARGIRVSTHARSHLGYLLFFWPMLIWISDVTDTDVVWIALRRFLVLILFSDMFLIASVCQARPTRALILTSVHSESQNTSEI